MKKKPERKHSVIEEPQPPKHSYKLANKIWKCSRCGNELGTNNGRIPDCQQMTKS